MGNFFEEIVSDFNNDIKYEKGTRDPMDRFYREVWGVTDIEVEDYDTESGKINQRKDRDVLLTSKNGRKVYVSEKSRRGKWDDILIEIYSVYPRKLGWSVHSEADIIAYVRTQQNLVTEISVKTLLPVANQILRTLDPGVIERLIRGGNKSQMIKLFLYGKDVPCRLICARNRGYETISVAISDSDLKQMGVNMRDFPFNAVNESKVSFLDILE